ncbi:hypothetical protein GPECTOR_10g818 [Gonium pectorale]|uniref:Uncharacterized protein n=1 Tax=Gonium pectorale TaxID=33097 RepID=A0A150GR20_GONPE|nr:hypothetical protein GPECTOR_10g818 [Gonium pectorale]|eukprot:KXZ52188.1 hypothetical protein GPECTOR_10g818 [Gonium pectorale]
MIEPQGNLLAPLAFCRRYGRSVAGMLLPLTPARYWVPAARHQGCLFVAMAAVITDRLPSEGGCSGAGSSSASAGGSRSYSRLSRPGSPASASSGEHDGTVFGVSPCASLVTSSGIVTSGGAFLDTGCSSVLPKVPSYVSGREPEEGAEGACPRTLSGINNVRGLPSLPWAAQRDGAERAVPQAAAPPPAGAPRPQRAMPDELPAGTATWPTEPSEPAAVQLLSAPAGAAATAGTAPASAASAASAEGSAPSSVLYVSPLRTSVVSVKLHGHHPSAETFPEAAAEVAAAAERAFRRQAAVMLAAAVSARARAAAAGSGPRRPGFMSALAGGVVVPGCVHLIQIVRVPRGSFDPSGANPGWAAHTGGGAMRLRGGAGTQMLHAELAVDTGAEPVAEAATETEPGPQARAGQLEAASGPVASGSGSSSGGPHEAPLTVAGGSAVSCAAAAAAGAAAEGDGPLPQLHRTLRGLYRRAIEPVARSSSDGGGSDTLPPEQDPEQGDLPLAGADDGSSQAPVEAEPAALLAAYPDAVALAVAAGASAAGEIEPRRVLVRLLPEAVEAMADGGWDGSSSDDDASASSGTAEEGAATPADMRVRLVVAAPGVSVEAAGVRNGGDSGRLSAGGGAARGGGSGSCVLADMELQLVPEPRARLAPLGPDDERPQEQAAHWRAGASIAFDVPSAAALVAAAGQPQPLILYLLPPHSVASGDDDEAGLRSDDAGSCNHLLPSRVLAVLPLLLLPDTAAAAELNDAYGAAAGVCYQAAVAAAQGAAGGAAAPPQYGLYDVERSYALAYQHMSELVYDIVELMQPPATWDVAAVAQQQQQQGATDALSYASSSQAAAVEAAAEAAAELASTRHHLLSYLRSRGMVACAQLVEGLLREVPSAGAAAGPDAAAPHGGGICVGPASMATEQHFGKGANAGSTQARPAPAADACANSAQQGPPDDGAPSCSHSQQQWCRPPEPPPVAAPPCAGDTLVWGVMVLKHVLVLKHLLNKGVNPWQRASALAFTMAACSPWALMMLRPQLYAKRRTAVYALLYELPFQMLMNALAWGLIPTCGNCLGRQSAVHFAAELLIQPGLLGIPLPVLLPLMCLRAAPLAALACRQYGVPWWAGVLRGLLSVLSPTGTSALIRFRGGASGRPGGSQ